MSFTFAASHKAYKKPRIVSPVIFFSVVSAGTAVMKYAQSLTWGMRKCPKIRLILIAAALCLLPARAAAQTQSGGPTDHGTTAGFSSAYRGTYPAGGIDTVNYYNGYVSLNLPLGSIGGRGSVGYQPILSVSRTFVMRHYQYWAPAGTGGTSWSQPRFKFISEGYNDSYDYSNVRAGLGPGVMIGRKMRDHNPNLSQGNPTDCTALTKLFLRIAGGEVEFRDAPTNGNPNYDGGFHPLNRGRVWRTVDGSAMTFVSDADISDETCGDRDFPAMNGINIIRPTGYLMMKDGTRYRFVQGVASWMRDRNGNMVTFGSTGGVVDADGRQYQVSDTGGVTYKGVGGVDRTVAVINGSLSTALRSDFVAAGVKSEQALFPSIGGSLESPTSVFNPTVVKTVHLPNNLEYHFYYDAYGQLSRLELPTGGSIEYDYNDTLQMGSSDSPQFVRQVKERRVYDSPGHLQLKQTFAYSAAIINNAIHSVTTVTAYDYSDNPSGVIVGKERHTFKGTMYDDAQFTGWYQAFDNGREVKSEALDAAGNPLRQVDSTWSGQTGLECVLTAVQTKLIDTNQVSKTTYAYDSYGNLIDTYEYDLGAAGSGSVGGFVRRTHTDYVTTPAYVNADLNPAVGASLRALPLQQWVSSDLAGNSKAALTAYAYDQFGLSDCPGIVGHDTAYDTAFNARGNPTGVTRYADAAGLTGAVTASSHYDIAGNAVSATDARGNTSTVSYADSFSDGNNLRNTYAFPTSTASAVPDPTGQYGSNSPLTSSSVYDFSTGMVIEATDANGRKTSYEYDDPLDRLTKVTKPDGGRTTYSHVEIHQCGPYVETKTLLDSSGRESHTWQFFDGLGRSYLSESTDGQDANNPYLRVDTRYDALGRVSQVSSPYRTAGCTSTANPSGRWTTTAYDALGRVKSVTTPDGAAVTTAYSGNTTTVTDQAGKKRSSVSDALGRLTTVTEDPTAGGLNYITTYTYDVLGNLRKVDQGGQLRFFMYDSFSRLLRAKNPEQAVGSVVSNMTDPLTGNAQWSIAYGYDSNGNLTARVDARNITTNYAYDTLNRNTSVSYTDGTMSVGRVYDKTDNGLGRLSWDWTCRDSSDCGSLNSYNYDVMGRVYNKNQHFWVGGAWSRPYASFYAYDRAGNVTGITYPSGRTASYTYDAAGRTSGFSGDLGDGVQRTYSAGITYGEFGGIYREQFGTQTPLYHKLRYNVRGQLYAVMLSSVDDESNWNRGMLVNHYGSGDFQAWGTSGPNNNGNVLRSHHYVPNDDQVSGYTVFFQDYEYDSLNRLTKVTESNSVTWTAQYAQKYEYDRWGNRTINAAQTFGVASTQFELQPQANQEVAEPSNRLYAPGDSARAPSQKLMRYDAAGNLTYDGYTGQGSRVYDAEDRMTQAQDVYQQWSTYTYDGNGRRVKRLSAGQETWQVYGIGGELLAEYQAGAATFLATKEYGYRSGELLVTMSSGDTQRLKRFIKNLYYNCLARDPNSTELQQKTDQLAQAGVQGEQSLLTAAKSVARGLFESSEYVARDRTNTEYVTDLYNAYLQRAPDSDGLGFWVSDAQNNGRGHTLTSFEVSSEFQTLSSTVYGRASGDNQRVEHFVDEFYLGAYNRFPTAAERQQQAQRLNNAAAVSQSQLVTEARNMGAEVFQATNYNSTHSNSQYVTDLYEAFLQRAPDGLGLSFWVGKVQNEGRASALSGFQNSIEFGELAGTLYRETFWLVPDHLGTPRMVVDKSGSLAGVKRHDYLPFGDELGAGTAGRAPAQGYSAVDNVRQKFTGKERDNETSLDYFLARYYSSQQGRFVSTDPLSTTNHPANPQGWNSYSYVLNNPLKLVDPDGMMWVYHYLDRAHRKIGIAWIDGNKIPKSLSSAGYRALDFGGQSSLNLTTTDGSIVRLSANSRFYEQLRGPQQGGSEGAYVNTGLIRELGRRTAPMPAFTVAFALVSLNGGYMIAGSSLPALNAAAHALYVMGEMGKDHPQENTQVIGSTQSLFRDVTKGGSIRNIETDVSKSDFINNMQASGYKVTMSGNAVILDNGVNRYTVYDTARSTGGPTAARSIGGVQDLKIRLKP